MSLIVRNDELITVGVTPGLTAGSSSFTFDGTGTPKTPDYRLLDIKIKDTAKPFPLVEDHDYTWDDTFGKFDYVDPSISFVDKQSFNVGFKPFPQTVNPNHYSFINFSFFIRDINIVNIGKQQQVSERMISFIQRYEAECLTKILGKTLYDIVLTEDSGRVKRLVDGITFEGKYWQGLVHEDISLIANYIYYFYQEADAKQTTGTGTKAPKVEAGEQVSPIDKMVNAWRFFASETRDMCSFLWNNKEDGVRVYPEFTAKEYNYTMNLARKGGVNKYGF